MIADIFGESGDEEEEEFTVSSGSFPQAELLQLVSSVSSLRIRISSWVHLRLLLLQGFNQEDLGVVEKESKAKKHQEEESDSDEGMERGAQE